MPCILHRSTVPAPISIIRTFVPSYVGFPKDAVSRKMFGRDVIFGDEALKHRMALNLFRPFDKGMIKYADTNAESKEYKNALYIAKALLQHLVDLAKEGDQEIGVDYIVRGVIGAPALASRKNRKALLDVARGILDGVMISSEPFTVAYGLNLLSNALIIDIGAGTVDLCRMHGT
ncbi:magnetosome protein MamK, partial [Candidatus Magnetobacterium bavaricum]